MAFLDHYEGHCLAESLHHDFSCSESEISHPAQFLDQSQLRITLVQIFECLGMRMAMAWGGSSMSSGTVSLGARDEVNLQALDVSQGQFLQVVAFYGHKCTTIVCSTWGTSVYPLAGPPSRVVRVDELTKQDRAVKGAFCVFVSSSCTSRNKGTWAGCSCEPPTFNTFTNRTDKQ